MSPHFAFLSTAGTARAYATADADTGMWCAAAGDDDVESTLTLSGAPTVPLPTTRTEWSSYPGGVDGGALDAGDVDVDIDDSGVSGVSGVLGVDVPEYGGAPAWTGTGGGMGFGGDVDGGCCDRAANEGVGAIAPDWAALYGVVEGMGDGAGEGRTYVG